MSHRKPAAILAACLIIAMAGPCATGAEAAAPERAKETTNIRITLEIGRMEGGRTSSSKSYEIVTTANGETTSMSTRTRIPIPTSTFNTAPATGERIVPVTSFTYQDVGVSARVGAIIGGTGGILVEGSVEASYLQDGKGGADPAAPPSTGTLSQELNVLLRDGTPVRVTSVDDGGRGALYLEIKADILK